MTDPLADGEQGDSCRQKINETITKGNNFETYNPDLAETDNNERAFVKNKPKSAFIDSANYNRPGQTTEGLINNQLNIYEDYLTLVFQPNRDGIHTISADFVWSSDSNTQDVLALIDVTGDQGFAKQFDFMQAEAPDAGGAGPTFNTIIGGAIGPDANTGSDQLYPIHFERELNLLASENYTIILAWAASDAGILAAIHNGQLKIQENISG